MRKRREPSGGRGASRAEGRRRQGVNRLAAGFDHGWEADGAVPLRRGARRQSARHSRRGRASPCARGMIPLESPLREIRTAGSVSGERKRGQARD